MPHSSATACSVVGNSRAFAPPFTALPRSPVATSVVMNAMPGPPNLRSNGLSSGLNGRFAQSPAPATLRSEKRTV